MANLTADFSQFILFIGVLAFVVSVITEALKKWEWFDKKVPTALVVICLSLVLCPVAMLGMMQYLKQPIEWYMETLPMMPEKMQLVVIRQTAKQYGLVKKQLFRKDVNQIIIATDAGREGELVARWILEKSECKKPIKRLWISSVTDKAIREGFANLRDGRAYNNLYHAAKARAEADWLVGINATRAMTCKYNAQLSCGRVRLLSLPPSGSG